MISKQHRLAKSLPYVILTFILVVAWVVIIGILFFGDGIRALLPAFGSATGSVTVTADSLPTPTQADLAMPAVAETVETSAEPTPTPALTPEPALQQAAVAGFQTPTAEPGGSVVSVRPTVGQTAWWSSDGLRGSGNDSFLYAGQFDDKLLVSVIVFDLRLIPPGTTIHEIALRLVGLREDRLVPSAGGRWIIDVLTPGIVPEQLDTDFATVFTAPVFANLTSFDVGNLAVGRENTAVLPVAVTQWIAEQIERGYPQIMLRIRTQDTNDATLFAWDTGLGTSSLGNSPELVISLGVPPVTPLPPLIVTPSPVPENVQTAAAMSIAATLEAQRIGTPTPFPYNYVIATTTPPPIVVTSTPMPANAATAQAIILDATAIALTTGTFTPTPTNMVTATPTPQPTSTPTIPLIRSLNDLTPTATPTPTQPPPDILPPDLVGQILFWSNRDGGEMRLYALNPNSGALSLISQQWPYALAKSKEAISPDGRMEALVQEDLARVPQVKIYDREFNVVRQLTTTNGWSFDPAWSPLGDRIAFVSQEPGNDEIFLISPDGANQQRLTANSWEWDKHPSWSPDGSQIVFWSNRETGRRQLWIMNADGSNQRRLLDSPADDWDPVWVK